MSNEEPSNSGRVVEVAVAPNEITADLWRQVLEDEGIIVALKPGGAGFAFGSSALMEHSVLVREDQADLARSIIAGLEMSDDED
jgi:hypothetical protein